MVILIINKGQNYIFSFTTMVPKSSMLIEANFCSHFHIFEQSNAKCCIKLQIFRKVGHSYLHLIFIPLFTE